MARSIHTTRRTLSELSKKNFSDGKQKVAALEEAADSLNRKRRIKRMSRAERLRSDPPIEGTSVSTIPIDVCDENKFVHHCASVDDVRAILNTLPEGVTLGISRIQLSLGKAYMDERSDDMEGHRDPYTKRLGCEVLPGVFCGYILGHFTFKSGLVSVFAYVYDRERIALPLPLCQFYLRLHALKTLVHEIAHHHDRVARVARGRWCSDRKENAEWYAEKMEHQWTQEIVLPYLQRAYPREAAALIKWVAHRGGLRIGMDFFVGDSRRTRRDGLVRLVFGTSGAFENWVGELSTCKSLAESRLAFSWQLHYSDLYEECVKILNELLKVSPDWVPALTCKADTLIHLENYEESLITARRALALDPTNDDAWETQGDAFERQDNWAALLQNCDAWEQSGRLRRRAKRELLMHRAVAHCATDNLSAVEVNIAAFLALIIFKTPEAAARRKKIAMGQMFRRAGKPVPQQYSFKTK